jgi:hypothetical protein
MLRRNLYSFAKAFRTFPSEMISLSAVAFPFILSSISFLQSVSGYQVLPDSLGPAATPLLPLLYESGFSLKA